MFLHVYVWVWVVLFVVSLFSLVPGRHWGKYKALNWCCVSLFRFSFGMFSYISTFIPVFFSFFVTFIYSAFVSLLVAFIHSLSSSRSLSLLNKGTEACTEDIQQMDFLHVIKVTLALLYWEISVVLFNWAHELLLENSEALMSNGGNFWKIHLFGLSSKPQMFHFWFCW